jgi:hypothetical protein
MGVAKTTRKSLGVGLAKKKKHVRVWPWGAEPTHSRPNRSGQAIPKALGGGSAKKKKVLGFGLGVPNPP